MSHDSHEKSSAYRPDIDGLRAIAVFSVFVFHAFPKVLQGGFVGVDVFFVISGFLISSIIFSQLGNGSFSFWNFYSRRIRRIYPTLLTVLISCLAFGFFFLLADEFMQLGKHVAGGAGFISNFILWFESGYFDNAAEMKPLLHLWSLGIEEQFYIIWPLLLWLAWKKRFNLFTISLLLAIVSFALNLHFHKTDPTADFFSPYTRFWELLAGAMLAWGCLHYRDALAPLKARLDTFCEKAVFFRGARSDSAMFSHVLSVVGMALLVLSVLVTREKGFPGKWALVPVIATVLVIAAGKDGFFNRILSNRVLVWFGLISYPMYLWHWPLLSMARIVQGETPPIWYRLAAFPVCVVLAWLTTKFIENPLRFGKHGKAKTIVLFAVMALLGASAYLIYHQKGLPKRFPKTVQILSDIQIRGFHTNDMYHSGCHIGVKRKTDYHSCKMPGKHPDKPTIAIWGDSHATAIAHGFKTHFQDRYNIWLRGRGACQPIFDRTKTNSNPVCIENNQFVLDEIKKNKPDIVILQGHWYMRKDYKDIFASLEKTVIRLRAAGVGRIILMGSTPGWERKLPTILISKYQKTKKLPLVLKPEKFGLYQQVDKEMAELARQWHVEYISLAAFLCSDKGCVTTTDNTPEGGLMYDRHHLTGWGSDYLVSLIKKEQIFSDNHKNK